MRSTSRAVIVLLALALIAAACGDDDVATTSADTFSDDTVAPVTEDTATTVTEDTAAPPTTSAPATTTEGVVGGPDVTELLALFQVTPLRTTYLLGEGDDQTEIVLAQDPTASPPIESIAIEEANAKIIISEEMTIFCDGSSNMCFEVPGASGDSLATGLLGPFASGVFLTAGPGGALAGAALTEEPITVAGRDGVCFTYEAPGVEFETDFIRQCIDNELGFTLLLQSSDATDVVETVMELTDFARPTAEDFEPTGPVTPSS